MVLYNKGVICPYSCSRLVNMTNPRLNRAKHGFVFILLLLIGLIRTAAGAPTQLRYNGQTNLTSRELWKLVDGGNITHSESIKNTTAAATTITNSYNKMYKGDDEYNSRVAPNNDFIQENKNRANISFISSITETSILLDDVNNTGGHVDTNILTTVKSTTVVPGSGGEKKKKKRKKIDRGNKEKIGKITTQTMVDIINTPSTKIKANRATTVATIITEPEITTFDTQKISTVSNIAPINLIDLTFENTEKLEVGTTLTTISPPPLPPIITTMTSIVTNERDDIMLNKPIINRKGSDLSTASLAPMIDIDNHVTPPTTIFNFDSTVLPTDAYFISGLSDLLLENGGYEKIAELEDTFEMNANFGQNTEEILNYKENNFHSEQFDMFNATNNIYSPDIELKIGDKIITNIDNSLNLETTTEQSLVQIENTTEKQMEVINKLETKVNKNDDLMLQIKDKSSVNSENVSGHRKKLRRKPGTRRRLNVNKTTTSPILSSFADDTVLSKNTSDNNIMASTMLNLGVSSIITEASITSLEIENVATTYQSTTDRPTVDDKGNFQATTIAIPLLSTTQEVNNYNDNYRVSLDEKIKAPIMIHFDDDEIISTTAAVVTTMENSFTFTSNNGTSFIFDSFDENHIETNDNIEITHKKVNNSNISTVIEVEITENYNTSDDSDVDGRKLDVESDKYVITSFGGQNVDENVKNVSLVVTKKNLETTDADLKQLVTGDGRVRDDSSHVAIKTMKIKLGDIIEPNGADDVMNKSINEEYKEESEVNVITTLPTVNLHDKSESRGHSSSELERVSTVNEVFDENTTKWAIEESTINRAVTTTNAIPSTSLPNIHTTFEIVNEKFDVDGYEVNSDKSQNNAFERHPITSTEIDLKIEDNVNKHNGEFDTSGLMTTVEKPVTDDHHFDKGKPTTVDRDSDTIFYISNTEVKVVESIPTPNTNQENRFFPALYEEDVFIDFPGKNHSGRNLVPDKYEEDIILSPLKSNFDPMRGIDLISDEDNLSVSYVGESFIEIEESTSSPTTATPSPLFLDLNNDQIMSSDVIIQPVIIPDIPMSIGVPVIAEFPTQLEFKRLTNMGSDLSQSGSNADMGYDDDNIMIDQAVVTFQELEPPGAYLKKAQLSAELKDVAAVTLAPTLPTLMRKKNGTKTLPVKRNGNLTSSTDIYSSNATAYYVEEEEVDTGFSDLQTLFLACLATLAPLFLSVLIAFAVRYLWRKYRRDHSGANGLIGDTSTDPLAVKSRTLSADELKSTESGLTIINRSSDTLESTSDMLTATKHDDGFCGVGGGGGGVGNKTNHPGANGSVITMTLKNNHLIVETEERNDISRDARETKLHYSPSEKDGVFVVEVARGADSTGMAPSVRHNDKKVDQKVAVVGKGDNGPYENGPTRNIVKEDDCKIANNQVQVHQPPDGVRDDDAMGINGDDGFSVSSFRSSANTVRPQCYCANTGLSQSDLSINSSAGSNQNYCYGTQSTYNVETKGYKSSSPVMCQQLPNTESTDDMKLLLDNNNSSSNNTNNSNSQDYDPNKPIITAAIYKQDTNGRDTDGNYQSSLNSDMIAHEGALQKKEAAFLEEQRLLGNGEEPIFVETTVMAKIELQNEIKEDEEKIKKLETENNIVAGDQKNSLTNGKGDFVENLNSMIVENGDGYDSLLPEPPSSDEIHQLNELTLLDGANTMDSLPPPPPPTECIVDVQTTNGPTTVTTPSATTTTTES